MNKNNPFKIGVLSLEINKAATGRVQLTPAGNFRASDGRPDTCPHWVLDDAIAKKVLARLAARKNDIVIDYEHQTQLAGETGTQAPAAGWWKGSDVEFTREGLFAAVRWTPKAQEYIQNDEYRYISPVLLYNRHTGEVIDIINAALTNQPAIDGMDRASLTAAQLVCDQLNKQFNQNNPQNPKPTQKPKTEPNVDKILELLRQLLGLPADATEEQILTALEGVSTQLPADKPKDGEAALTLSSYLKNCEETIAALTIAAKATPKPKQPDMTKFVPIEAVTELTTRVTELTNRLDGDERTTLINAALADGRLTKGLTDWAQKVDLTALQGFLKNAPAITALTKMQTTDVTVNDNKTCALTAAELNIAKLTGLTPKEFAEAKLALEEQQS